jgi:trk system potassium uptake protein TrkA
MIAMRVIIVGAGRTGSFLACELKGQIGEVMVIEKDSRAAEEISKKGIRTVVGDACDPAVLHKAGIEGADVAVVVTGHDEDNLVIANLLKKVFRVKRIIARINHPLNEWLYKEDFGVDVSVSSTHIIADLILEEMKLKRSIEILKISGGMIAVLEVTLADDSNLVGKSLKELQLPPNSLIFAVVRKGKIIIPGGDFIFIAGDKLLGVCTVESEKAFNEILSS